MINKVMLMGRLGKDPMIKRLENGKVVANITLATNEYYQRDGERQELTEWHSLEMWDKHAEFAEKHLKKGRIIYVEGKIRTDRFVDGDGQEKQNKKIRVTSVQFIDVQGKSNKETDQEF